MNRVGGVPHGPYHVVLNIFRDFWDCMSLVDIPVHNEAHWALYEQMGEDIEISL